MNGRDHDHLFTEEEVKAAKTSTLVAYIAWATMKGLSSRWLTVTPAETRQRVAQNLTAVGVELDRRVPLPPTLGEIP